MLVMSHHVIPFHDPRPAENIAKNTQSPERGSYDLYRPSVEDNLQFVDMLPPPQSQEEPDYYAVKPKKTKKYSATDEKEKKYKKFENLKAKIVKLDDYDEAELNQEANDYPAGSEESSTPSSEESARTQREVDSGDDEEGDQGESNEGGQEKSDKGEQENPEGDQKSEEIEAAEASDSSVETSAPSSRLDFHMNGN